MSANAPGLPREEIRSPVEAALTCTAHKLLKDFLKDPSAH